MANRQNKNSKEDGRRDNDADWGRKEYRGIREDRGKAKMTERCGIALCVMLAMAVGRIKEKQEDKMRSLVRSA